MRSNFLRLFRTKPIKPRFILRSNVYEQNQNPAKYSDEGDPENFDYYTSLGIYKDHNWLELFNLLLMTTACSNEFVVDNCHRFYDLGKKVFGSRATDYTIASTMGRIFTGGDTIHTMEKFINDWKYPRVNLVIAYSNEISLGQSAPLEELDENARIFADTIDLSAHKLHGNSGVAIKCSCLVPPEVMEKANQSQLRLRSIFSDGFDNLDQELSVEQIQANIQGLGIRFSFYELQEFIAKFFNIRVTQDNANQTKISKFDWLCNMHMFYVQDPQKTNNPLLRKITKLDEKDLVELDRYSQRLNLIFERAIEYNRPCLVDAEQSYYQETIDSFNMQFSNIYNKKSAIILGTYQNYLKTARERLAFEVERCKALNICLGAKMVRGAYMVEERRLARKYGYPDPILPSIEETHSSFNDNLEYLVANWIKGSHVLVASHNEYSVQLAKDLIIKHDITPDKGFVTFAQLLGLGDHLTFSLANQNYPVAKYVAFGPVNILIPFFVRRAQETKQMFESTGLQRSLVFDEISRRLGFRK